MSCKKSIFSRVLFVGPSRKGQGGISSVLDIYSRHLPDFRQLTTNSPDGTIAGIWPMLRSMLSLPAYRIIGRRILHVHAATGKSFIRKSILMAEAKLLGYKIVFHSHGGTFNDYYASLGLKKSRCILRLASRIIVLSSFWQRYYESTFGMPNVSLIYNPVDPPTQASMTMPRREPLQLLFLGLVVDTKGIFDLIEVIGANRDRWRGRVHLTIGGVGETERLFARANELNITDFITHLGWTKGAERDAAFAGAHVLVLPSYAEGVPMSIVEVMIRRKAVISTYVGGVPEVVTPDETGFLIQPADKKALERAIDCYLLNPDLVERHGKKGEARAANFLPNHIIEQLECLYSNL